MQQNIDDLIVKFLNHELTKEEVYELKEILKKPEHEHYVKNEIKLHHLIQANLNSFNAQNAYNEHAPKTSKTKPVKVLRSSSVLKYAVAASIALLISIAYFTRNEWNVINNSQKVVESSITAGTDKAVLTLEDGSEVVLEKGENYETDNITSNGKEIIYHKASKLPKEEVAYNYLTIPRGGQYFVKLSDGTRVWLNSESRLKYPANFIEGELREVELEYGEAYLEVSPSNLHKDAKFKVISGNQNIEVLGTKFNVKAYKDETKIYTTLVEGKVLVDNATLNKILTPGEQSVFNVINNSLDVNQADVNSEISWIKGDFVFNKKSLKDIMKVLSRWYDVNVVFENKTLEQSRFNGELSKYQNLEEILALIKNTNIISAYEIKNNTIILK